MSELKVGDVVTLDSSAVCTRLVKSDNSLCVESKTLPQEEFTVRAVNGRLPTAGPTSHDRAGLVQNDVILQSEFTGKIYFARSRFVQVKCKPIKFRRYNTLTEFSDDDVFTSEATPADITDKMLQEIAEEKDLKVRMERVRELRVFVEASRLL